MSEDGKFLLSLLASYAQSESENCSDNVKWMIRERFKLGELVTLRFLYGYTIDKQGIRINEEEAEIVRWVFSQYGKKIELAKIARELNAKGIPLPSGRLWNVDRVKDLLRNEKYAGNALLQKVFTVDHLSKRKQKNRGELPQ